MPWYWTDDLARTLIDAGTADPSQMGRWLSAPVAIRSADTDTETVARSLLDEEEEGDLPSLPVAA